MPVASRAKDDFLAPLAAAVAETAHLMTDGHKSMTALGAGFAAHDSVNHNATEYSRGLVHANSAEGLNDRIRRTVAGVYHHISTVHAEHYLNEVSLPGLLLAEIQSSEEIDMRRHHLQGAVVRANAITAGNPWRPSDRITDGTAVRIRIRILYFAYPSRRVRGQEC